MPTAATNPKHLADTQKTCPACQKLFTPSKYYDQKTCGDECANAMPRAKPRGKEERQCPVCPATFWAVPSNPKKCCSPSCAAKYQWKDPAKRSIPERPLVSLTCTECQCAFFEPKLVTPAQIAKGYPKTCSPECRHAYYYETRKCWDCKTEFDFPKHRIGVETGRYCSTECATTAKAYRWRARRIAETKRSRGLKPYGAKRCEYAGHQLDSGWELLMARRLDALGILWTRGHHQIPWQDSFGEWFQYAPDFYLCDYDAFIEVKGNHLIWLDETESDKQGFITGHCKDVVFVRSAKECREFTIETMEATLKRQRSEVI